MTNDPALDDPRRKRMEAAIRIVDLFIYAFIFGSGVFATLFSPKSVTDQLGGFIVLIAIWNGLLLFGGVVGFAGRLYRLWILEIVAAPAAAFGAAIYAAVLAGLAVNTPTVWVAVCLMLVTLGTSVRRWLELNIFTEPTVKLTFGQALRVAAKRRTVASANRG